MALRITLGRRFLCTSTVSSQFPPSLAAAGAEAADAWTEGVAGMPSRVRYCRGIKVTGLFPASAARNKPALVPSDTLFLSGINKRTMNEKLHEAFSKFGQVVHANVAMDRNNGYSTGYGFVKYAMVEEAAKGIEGMDAKFLEGWVIFAEYARPRPPLGQDRAQDVNGASNRW